MMQCLLVPILGVRGKHLFIAGFFYLHFIAKWLSFLIILNKEFFFKKITIYTHLFDKQPL